MHLISLLTGTAALETQGNLAGCFTDLQVLLNPSPLTADSG